jgi:hypothetical protein
LPLMPHDRTSRPRRAAGDTNRRPVAARAILTLFSTASAPVVTKVTF